ncbi:hypothetical protein B0H63DRAFT_298289 [Podospora didyma]|uniref:Tr-type G domain-containing protein n=1 Tax=Podospora didyma TaxID=330526 RepID=A0AAE0N7N7_9PEZI|nr:hypothetical protein B0H63DRAFT_298289 [Podospora didyma]
MSVFTFDPDPPRVASPWLRPADPSKRLADTERSATPRQAVEHGLLSDYGVTKLEAEPQDGPTEYKLHLLLRPRRKYERTTTANRISGSTQSRPPLDLKLSKSSPAPARSATSLQTRQSRLEHLTTQLLWRLQQSCPYHSSSDAPGLVIPQLPDDSVALNAQVKLAKLLPGLEASRGALYEIGVADDGTLAGLTKDEMDESLSTLRIMAASLGCNMKVLRMVTVGECEWLEPSDPDESSVPPSNTVRRQAKLWVAEALVLPELRPRDSVEKLVPSKSHPLSRLTEALPNPKHGPLTADQLRVTLTGPTTSGKSTLLGTLSTGTRDNGRGKSRLSLLKHLHEVASGMTSSVAQELVGYNDGSIINYAHRGVESWLDIHDFTKTGRLVYLLDSAGHPRYRRTILRGIVGWSPHWTMLCIAADSAEVTSAVGATSSAIDVLGPAGAGVDLADAHLDLCLRLQSPLVVVITKLDLANKSSLSNTLSKVLSGIKRAGRTPAILKGDPASHSDLNRLSVVDCEAVRRVVESMAGKEDLLSVIPIVLTSAVDGRGVGLLHAMLQKLPLPPRPTSHDFIGAALNPEQPDCLFHIEDKFSLPASYALATSDTDQQTDLGTVVAGYLRFGSLSIGDKVIVGPFPPDDDDSRGPTPDERMSGGYGLSLSHPSSTELSRIAAKNAVSASAIQGEWHSASIVSIRNLRLPVQTLTAGQVGSIGMVFDLPLPEGVDDSSPALPVASPRLRKGMVLAVPSEHMVATGLTLQAASGLTAAFDGSEVCSLTIGSLVNIYVASIRASARVLRVSGAKAPNDQSKLATEDIDGMFVLGEDANGVEDATLVDGGCEVQLELLSNREWIELGSRILILEGGSRDKSGLEGFVGQVVEITE